MIDLLKPAPISEFYERHADFWEEARGKGHFLEKKYIDYVLNNRPVGTPVLDVGCGTGRPIAEYIISQGVGIEGCDVTAAMISKATQRFPKYLWHQGDMRTIELGRRFGGLIAWDSLFHLSESDQRLVLPRFQEHLLPQGVILFTSGPSAGEQIGAMDGELLYHASLSPQEYTELLTALGFTDIKFVAKDTQCGNHAVWTARLAFVNK